MTFRIHVWTTSFNDSVYDLQVKKWWGWKTLDHCISLEEAGKVAKRYRDAKNKEGYYNL